MFEVERAPSKCLQRQLMQIRALANIPPSVFRVSFPSNVLSVSEVLLISTHAEGRIWQTIYAPPSNLPNHPLRHDHHPTLVYSRKKRRSFPPPPNCRIHTLFQNGMFGVRTHAQLLIHTIFPHKSTHPMSRLTQLVCATLALMVSASSAKTYLDEAFTEDSFKQWVHSNWKGEENTGKFEVTSGEWPGDKDLQRGIRTSEDAKFYAISRKLDVPFSNEGKTLVVQYAVKNEKKESSFCGGGYIKLMPSDIDQTKFGGESPYHIMFGPDLCGFDVSRVHLIFSKDGENMLRKEDIKLEWNDKEAFTNLYTLIINPDNTYKVLINDKERASGNLGDGNWAKFPLQEIDDASDNKPADWVEEARIVDPAAAKPQDWDENEVEMIKDPEAKKPEDWNDADDGAWEAPMTDNPKFKGKWEAPMIENPAYKGVWAPKKVVNPEYTGKSYVYSDIGSVGFELWVVNSGSIFSNIIITDSVEEAKAHAEKHFSQAIRDAEKDSKKVYDEKNKPKGEAPAADAEDADATDAAIDVDEEKEEL